MFRNVPGCSMFRVLSTPNVPCVTPKGEFLGRPHIFIDCLEHHQHGPPRDCLKANNVEDCCGDR